MASDIQPTDLDIRIGTYGQMSAREYRETMLETGGYKALIANGVCELNKKVKSAHPIGIDLPGVIELSPDEKDIEFATGLNGDPDFQKLTRAQWEGLAAGMADKTIKAIERHQVRGASLLWSQAISSGHLPIAEFCLDRIHKQDSSLFTVVNAILPSPPHERPQIPRGHELLQHLHETRQVRLAVLSDNASPLSLHLKRTTQDAYAARAWAAATTAQLFLGRNKSLGEFGRALGNFSPYASWRHFSHTVQFNDETVIEKISGFFGKRSVQRAITRASHVLQIARIATEAVLREHDTAAIDEPVNPDLPCLGFYILPVASSDAAVWERLDADLQHYLAVEHPLISPVLTAGQGVKDPRYPGRSWLQLSLLYPVPPVPAPIKALL